MEQDCVKDIHYNSIKGVTIGKPLNIDGRTIWKPDIAAESVVTPSGSRERIYITDPINHRIIIITEDRM
jgi:hypothetical protein